MLPPTSWQEHSGTKPRMLRTMRSFDESLEVAIRRVARKRGVAVEAPQTKLSDDTFEVNVTYVDDGRVLDSPEDLTQAFEHAIQTELAPRDTI